MRSIALQNYFGQQCLCPPFSKEEFSRRVLTPLWKRGEGEIFVGQDTSRLLKKPLAGCSKRSRSEARSFRYSCSWFVFEKRARARETSTISARRLSAPFDDAQGNRPMGLFEQPASRLLTCWNGGRITVFGFDRCSSLVDFLDRSVDSQTQVTGRSRWLFR
jgi:hypothetical protein